MPQVPGNPKDVQLTVTVNSEKPGDFTIEPDPLGSLPTGPNGELIFKNDGNSGFFVFFNLKDPNRLGYKFPPEDKINDAVWSELSAGACPEAGKWEVFSPRKILNNEMTLKVRNTNVKPEIGEFGYVLRITKDAGKNYHRLDPGGDNQNGPISRSPMNFAVAFVVGAAVGALVTLGTQALLYG